MGGVCSHVITLHRRGSGFVIRVDCARWGQTPEDLRHLALSAPHARTRERALAWLCSPSPSTAAPAGGPGAQAGGPTPCWAGCTPTTPRVLTRLRPAAPAAA